MPGGIKGMSPNCLPNRTLGCQQLSQVPYSCCEEQGPLKGPAGQEGFSFLALPVLSQSFIPLRNL